MLLDVAAHNGEVTKRKSYKTPALFKIPALASGHIFKDDVNGFFLLGYLLHGFTEGIHSDRLFKMCNFCGLIYLSFKKWKNLVQNENVEFYTKIFFKNNS